MSVSVDASLANRMEIACRDPEFCHALTARLGEILSGQTMRFMEVCGTHTVSIFRSGLRSLLPHNIIHLSGPGCPVCVTHDAEVSLFVELALKQDVILATFGDLLRVPDQNGNTLKHAQAMGANIRMVYSPLEAVAIARENPEKETVFLGAGFETTAPTVAASIKTAAAQNINNYSVFSMHKLVPPALKTLLEEDDCQIDAFLLPGHVATVTGLEPFVFLSETFNLPAVVGGFEPADILLALCELAEQIASGKHNVVNAYPRAVDKSGNPRALKLMHEVFEPATAMWRGLGAIPASGLSIRDEFATFDALKKLGLKLRDTKPIAGCRCGDVLKGRIQPCDCPLFGKKCQPANPVGPCMVSTEGSCAAHYKYGIS